MRDFRERMEDCCFDENRQLTMTLLKMKEENFDGSAEASCNWMTFLRHVVGEPRVPPARCA
jgi:hypothetical protein